MFAAASSKHTALVSLLVVLALLVAGAAVAGQGTSRDKQKPAAPSGVGVRNATPSSVTLAWSPAVDNVGVAGYYVFVNGQRARVTGTTHTASGLDCGSGVSVWIVAFDYEGNRSERAAAVVSTAACPDVLPPTAPSGFRQEATTQTSVVLSWNSSSDNVGVVGYGIYRGGLPVGSTTSPTTTVTGLACGTGYAYEVDAVDAAGNRSARQSAWLRTASCSDGKPPSTPTDVTVETTTTSSIALRWAPSTDDVAVAAYHVTVNGTVVTTVGEPSARVDGLACGTTYALGVSAVDAAGNRSSEARLSAATGPCPAPPAPGDTTAPSPPRSVTITSAATTSLAASWSPSADDVGVVGYGVYVNGSRVQTTGTTSATVSGLVCGTAYALGVDAVDAAGNRSPVSSVTSSTAPCADTQPPTQPTNVQASSRTATSIALTWSSSTDNVAVAGYGLYLGGQPVASTTQTTAIFPNLTCNTSYTLAVDAYDAAGNRSTKATVLVSTTACADVSPPTAPTGLAAGGVTQSSMALTWTASSDNVGVAGYDVYRNGAKVATVTSTSSNQTGLACGTSYQYAVRAFDAAGNVSPQAQLTASTAACSTPTSDWTFCALEYDRCSFAGTREVRYGKDGTWTTPRTFTDGVDCSNAVFGDPLPGTRKECWTRASSGSTTPAPSPSPSPSPGALPSTITKGGTYSGSISGSGTGAAVSIRTTEPVVIQDATISHSGTGFLIDANQAGVQLTVRRTTFNGGSGQALWANNFKSVTVESSTINKTWGIRLDAGQSGATVLITRNKFRDQTYDGVNGFWISHPVQIVGTQSPASAVVSWNEFVNVYGQSQTEDVISIYNSAFVKVHDNYVSGAYPKSVGEGYSGGGIIVDGPQSHDNELWNNIVVDTVNYGVAIAGGRNNRIHDNRVVFDGRNDSGQMFAAANIGVYVADFSNTGGGFTGNQAWANVAGWTNASGARNDWWLPGCQGSCSNSSLKSGSVTRDDELSEFQRWQQKLAGAGISIGA